MGKTDAEVIEVFNEQVNMSIEELQAWLDSPESEKAGTGVGHDSGRRIVEILKKNPDKDPKKYDEVRVRSFLPLSGARHCIDCPGFETGGLAAYVQGGRVRVQASLECRSVLTDFLIHSVQIHFTPYRARRPLEGD